MFELSDQQKDIRQAAREFAEGEFTDIASECDEKETFPFDVWKKACESGFIGGFIDEKYEGAGLGVLEYALILEEFWRVDPGCGNILLSTLGSELIQDYGNEEQKRKYLKATTITGTVPSEDHLSDFHYTKNRDEYVLNGSSKFVFNGTTADYLVILAKGENSQFTTFAIDKNYKGINTATFSEKLGVRACDIAEIALNNVIVPSGNVIGMEGQGLEQFDAFLDKLRIYNSAQAIGISQGCLEKAVKYSRQRVQFGHPIGWFQIVQFKIAEMATKIEAARNLCYKAAWECDHGRKDRKTLSMASWFAREAAGVVTAEALQIHGGYGYMMELDIQRFYRDIQFLEFFGASRETEKMRVAGELTGKLD
jgi:alkylation response protein AidB-like acyl-CoA dehydrogenase